MTEASLNSPHPDRTEDSETLRRALSKMLESPVTQVGWTPPGDLLRVSEAAALLGKSISTVRNLSNKGILKAYHIGSRRDRRFLREDIENFKDPRIPHKPLNSNDLTK